MLSVDCNNIGIEQDLAIMKFIGLVPEDAIICRDDRCCPKVYWLSPSSERLSKAEYRWVVDTGEIFPLTSAGLTDKQWEDVLPPGWEWYDFKKSKGSTQWIVRLDKTQDLTMVRRICESHQLLNFAKIKAVVRAWQQEKGM